MRQTGRNISRFTKHRVRPMGIMPSSHVDDGATVLLPEKDEEFVDYFADLQNHRLLGKIKNFEYVKGENHAHLDAEWTPDSKLCIATYWERYGFASAAVL